MAYKVNPHGLIRDKAYPSEIAAQRPLMAPRLHCEETWEDERNSREASIRGDRGYRDPETSTLVPPHPGPHPGDITEDRVALFNRQLRGGHSQEEQD